MKNKIIEKAIDDFIAELDEVPEFKSMFKKYLENNFVKNSNINDLKNLLTHLKVEEE